MAIFFRYFWAKRVSYKKIFSKSSLSDLKTGTIKKFETIPNVKVFGGSLHLCIFRKSERLDIFFEYNTFYIFFEKKKIEG
jgi:hypothetical protein